MIKGRSFLLRNLEESARLHSSSASLDSSLSLAANTIIRAISQGNKVLICGNGGSAADAQHIAGELVGRFMKERRGLPVISLTTDTSVITAWANDYSYNSVFLRQVESLGAKGDVLVVLSTSGNSENVIRAAAYARKIGMKVISFTGQGGGKLKSLSDVLIAVKSSSTPRIQEMHMICYHTLCEMVEGAFSR
jgi:D-sedoheptulose 7-phosphate isomerase